MGAEWASAEGLCLHRVSARKWERREPGRRWERAGRGRETAADPLTFLERDSAESPGSVSHPRSRPLLTVVPEYGQGSVLAEPLAPQ